MRFAVWLGLFCLTLAGCVNDGGPPSEPRLQSFGIGTVYIEEGFTGNTIPQLSVSLDSPALSDTVIDLSYSDDNIEGSSTVTISTGTISSPVTLTGVTASATESMLSASYLEDVATVGIRVYNDVDVRELSSFAPATQSIPVDGTGTLTIILNLPASTGGEVVDLAADLGVSVPASVAIPTKQLSASVTITAGPAAASALVTASLGLSSLTAVVNVIE